MEIVGIKYSKKDLDIKNISVKIENVNKVVLCVEKGK